MPIQFLYMLMSLKYADNGSNHWVLLPFITNTPHWVQYKSPSCLNMLMYTWTLMQTLGSSHIYTNGVNTLQGPR